jgi:hypothetical protein
VQELHPSCLYGHNMYLILVICLHSVRFSTANINLISMDELERKQIHCSYIGLSFYRPAKMRYLTLASHGCFRIPAAVILLLRS